MEQIVYQGANVDDGDYKNFGGDQPVPGRDFNINGEELILYVLH